MLIKADAKQLEWRVAAFLSQDTVALAEINNNEDIHSNNQERFRLPSRLIAKTFIFRLIYGGSEYSYAKDPEFTHVSSDKRFWKRVIDEFYAKYTGMAEWHESLVRRAIADGHITVPSGRRFDYQPIRGFGGGLEWPRTTILNYPVQGFSADLMMIARVSARKRLAKFGSDVLMINTVHDDIELDCNNSLDKGNELCYNVCRVMEQVFQDIPKNFERLYEQEFNVPLVGELSYGHNLKEMVEFSAEAGKEQFSAI